MKPFRIQIRSSSPEINFAEVFLPKGDGNYDTGWYVIKLNPEAFIGEKVVMSGVPKSDFQITAAIDFRKSQRRIVFAIGKTEPTSHLVVKLPKTIDSSGKNEIVVYWKNWKFEKAEWNNELLEEITDSVIFTTTFSINTPPQKTNNRY